ncbi:FimV/HubP family polar landmark protein [Kangiella japonica]|uniref:FimV/HubP family polar landmark protein n=1 Tax=Kangiella japonica TaxID=647384 RepID=A0ABN0T5E3_9GAMM
MFRKLAATVAVTAALISPSALSLGLGKIDAESGLNQPLKAEITLLSSNNVSEDDLRAKLASYDAYNKFGVQREAYHNTLFFKIITKNDGSKAIVVESREPIKEPFINFLIELNWAQGRLMREYTLLLDPPVFSKATVAPKLSSMPSSPSQATVTKKPTAPQQVERKVDSSPETVTKNESQPKAQQETKQEPKTEVSEVSRQLAATPDFTDDSWTVERGQTLWSIAKAVRPKDASVQQTLMAIFHNNPDAFINNDINRLKAGATLAVPERSTISDVSQTAAVNSIRNSTINADAPLDVRKSVDETAEEQTVEQGGRLSIASVDEGSLEDSGGSTLDDEATKDLALSEDSIDDTQSNNGDTTSEFGSDLATSDTATEDGFAVEDETLSVLSGAADAAEETDQVAINEPATNIAEDSLSTEDYSDGNSDGFAVSETDDNDTKSKADVASSTADQVESRNSLRDSEEPFYEAENFWLYTGGGLILVLLIGGGIVYRRNSQEVEDDGGLLGMMTAAKETKPKKRRESFIGDDGMQAPKEKVDAISAADILIARGKLEEAETVLEDALAAEPSNQEVRVKLMEVVASQQKTEQFFQLKKELPEDFDHDSALGLKVASLTSLVTPEDNSLQMDSGSDELRLPSEDDIFGDENSDPVELDLSDELSGKDVDVDTVSDDNGLDLDLEDFDKQVVETASDNTPTHDGSIEFTDSQDDEELVTQEDESVTSDVTDEFNTDDESGLSDSDAATKFDLAKAYMELGDDEAARDILEEIKSEGNSSQREEADKLLSSM